MRRPVELDLDGLDPQPHSHHPMWGWISTENRAIGRREERPPMISTEHRVFRPGRTGLPDTPW